MNSLLGSLSGESVRVVELEALYSAIRERPGVAADVIWAMRQLEPEVAWRAVWLLHRMAIDRRLTETDLLRIAACAEELTHWISRLGLCQLFAKSDCQASVRAAIFPFLADCFADRRVIVRAWAISALAGFRSDPKYRQAVNAMFRQARKDPKNAMQARLRRLPV